jgi:hypothetical protein
VGRFKEIETSDGQIKRAKSTAIKSRGSGPSLNCHVVDSWKVLSGGMDKKTSLKYLSDGLHLNETGRLVYQAFMETTAGKVSSPGAHGRRRRASGEAEYQ